ncbi:MAG: ribosome silencing factor [Dehalococcoidia bacterium]
MPLQAADLARKIVDLLSERQAEEIVLLNVEGVASFADYFVIASGQNVRHMQALCDAMDQELGRETVHPRGREGAVDSGWVLLDFGDVIVHIFAPAERDYYDLEGLWSRGVPVLRIQ